MLLYSYEKMRTAKQIIENIEDRLELIQEQLKMHKGNETYTNQLDMVEVELDDLLSWIKE